MQKDIDTRWKYDSIQSNRTPEMITLCVNINFSCYLKLFERKLTISKLTEEK